MNLKRTVNLTAFLRDLFFVETECTLSFAIIGTIFARNAAISYAHFFIPLVLGVVCMIPCLPVYFFMYRMEKAESARLNKKLASLKKEIYQKTHSVSDVTSGTFCTIEAIGEGGGEDYQPCCLIDRLALIGS